jgi:hypothetical protein
MKPILAFVLAAFLPFAAVSAPAAEDAPLPMIRPAGDSDLGEFMWTHRVLVVFADSPADPRFQEQIEILRQGEEELLDRDIVVLTDADPAGASAIRLRLRPRGFQLTLVDKDGGVKLRKPSPRSVREINRTIDKTPDRQREVAERRNHR